MAAADSTLPTEDVSLPNRDVYDSLDRLVKTSPGPLGMPNWTNILSYFTESYAYDIIGNLLTHTTQVSGSAASTLA